MKMKLLNFNNCSLGYSENIFVNPRHTFPTFLIQTWFFIVVSVYCCMPAPNKRLAHKLSSEQPPPLRESLLPSWFCR